jgi:hypothetical protein
VAFVLVTLFVGSQWRTLAAVTDTETIIGSECFFCGREAMASSGWTTVQLAVVCKSLIGVPVLVTWAYIVDDVVCGSSTPGISGV